MDIPVSKWLLLFKSRKFWAGVVGIVVIVIKQFFPDLPLDDAALNNFIYVIIAYIVGVAIDDNLTARRLQG